jgi:hypothetical protein
MPPLTRPSARAGNEVFAQNARRGRPEGRAPERAKLVEAERPQRGQSRPRLPRDSRYEPRMLVTPPCDPACLCALLLYPSRHSINSLRAGLLRRQRQAESLQEAAHRMRLPAGRLHDGRNGCALRTPEEREHPGLLHGRRAPLRSARRITAMAPTTSIWLRYRLPALVMPPRRTLLPEELAIFTSRCLTLPIACTKANGHQKVTTCPRETGSSCSFKPEVHTAEWSVT